MCDVNPCQNGGRCEERARGYVCLCMRGYQGNQCQISTEPGKAFYYVNHVYNILSQIVKPWI